MEEQEELENQSAKEQNIKLRNEWYQFSAHCVPAKYKLQYVHANANNKNEEIINDWYKECERIGLLPDKFKLIPEDQEQVIEKEPEKRKSFHKRRKDEWKHRKVTRTQFTVKEKMEKQEEKKKQFFKENKTRPPSLKFMLVILLALYMLGFGAATPVDPNGLDPPPHGLTSEMSSIIQN